MKQRGTTPILVLAAILIASIVIRFGPFNQLSANSSNQTPSQGILTQSLTLSSANSESGALHGSAVALLEDTLLSGQPGYSGHGALEIYTRNSRLDLWISEYFDVSGEDLDHPDDVGYSVAAQGNTFVVGAPNTHIDTDKRGHQGLVYLFQEVINNQEPELELVATLTEPSASQLPFDLFGYAVAVDGPFIVVGSPFSDSTANGDKDSGAVFIFDQRLSNWETNPYRLELESPQVRQLFGYAVDISNDTLIVGAPTPEDEFLRPGNAYIYQFDSESVSDPWDLKGTLTSDNTGAVGRFGSAVAIDSNSDIVAVGAADENGRQGAVYLFEQTQSGWSSQTIGTILHPNPDPSDPAQFGYSLDLENNKLAIGAPGIAEDPNGTGQAFLYSVSVNQPIDLVYEFRLIQGLDMIGTRFGESISIYGDRVAIGAPKTNGDRGTIYLYTDVTVLGQPTLTPSSTPTETSTPAITPTPSNTPTGTLLPTNTPTNTPTATNTPIPSQTPTVTPVPTETPAIITVLESIYMPLTSFDFVVETAKDPPPTPLPSPDPPTAVCLTQEFETVDGSNNTLSTAESPLCLETTLSARLSASDSIDLFMLPLSGASTIYATLTILDNNGDPIVVGNDPETAYSMSLFQLNPNEIKDHNGDSGNPKYLCSSNLYPVGEYLIFLQYNESASHGDGAPRDYELTLSAQPPAGCTN